MAAVEDSRGEHLFGPENTEWRPVEAMEDILHRYASWFPLG